MPGGTLDISGAEWEVMRSIWQARGPIPAAAVVAAVAGPCDWSPRTVKTLLNRLVKKKALGFEARGKVYWYYPLVAARGQASGDQRAVAWRADAG